jgi:hypothetical protein
LQIVVTLSVNTSRQIGQISPSQVSMSCIAKSFNSLQVALSLRRKIRYRFHRFANLQSLCPIPARRRCNATQTITARLTPGIDGLTANRS